MSTAPLVPPKNETTVSKRLKLVVLAAILPVLAVATVLFTHDPQHSTFYPICIFKKLTGWSCPACGCLRATHQLLHGNLANAFHLNPLYIVLLPILAWFAIRTLLGRPSAIPTSWIWTS